MKNPFNYFLLCMVALFDSCGLLPLRNIKFCRDLPQSYQTLNIQNYHLYVRKVCGDKMDKPSRQPFGWWGPDAYTRHEGVALASCADPAAELWEIEYLLMPIDESQPAIYITTGPPYYCYDAVNRIWSTYFSQPVFSNDLLINLEAINNFAFGSLDRRHSCIRFFSRKSPGDQIQTWHYSNVGSNNITITDLERYERGSKYDRLVGGYPQTKHTTPVNDLGPGAVFEAVTGTPRFFLQRLVKYPPSHPASMANFTDGNLYRSLSRKKQNQVTFYLSRPDVEFPRCSTVTYVRSRVDYIPSP
jgi:hypothetical protein